MMMKLKVVEMEKQNQLTLDVNKCVFFECEGLITNHY